MVTPALNNPQNGTFGKRGNKYTLSREEILSSDKVFEECHVPLENGTTSAEFKRIIAATDNTVFTSKLRFTG